MYEVIAKYSPRIQAIMPGGHLRSAVYNGGGLVDPEIIVNGVMRYRHAMDKAFAWRFGVLE